MNPSGSGSRLSLWQAAYVIARRDFHAILFSKAFLFFLLGPIFFIALTTGGGLLGAKAASNQEDPRLAIAMAPADSAAFKQAHDRLADMVTLPEITVVQPAAAADPAGLLNDDKRNLAAVVSGPLSHPRLAGTDDQIDSWRGKVALIAAAATGSATAYPDVQLAPTASSGARKRDERSIVAVGGVTLMFMLTMLLAGMVMSNLVEEKGNKIIEILAAAIPMDAVFLGKLFAMLAISVVGISVWGAIAGALVATAAPVLPAVTAPAVGWPLFVVLFMVYFSMGYLLIGSIFLTIGSMAPTVRDVQTMSMPATMLQLVIFFVANYAVSDPGSPLELGAAAFPLSSPYIMIARAAQQPELWVHALALAWQALWVAIFVKVGATQFRKRVMKSGPAAARRKGLLARIRTAIRSPKAA